MNIRTAAVATALILVGALTACSADVPEQGKAERATVSASSTPASGTPECTKDCADDSSGEAEKPDTELAVGDTFTYKDGLKVKVDSITTIKRWGEFDDKPEAGHMPFRVTWTVTNGTKKPYDLDGFGYEAQGATTGGETEMLFVEVDSKEMTGRLAAGRSGTFTAEYSLAKADGKDVMFTMSRMDDQWLKDESFLAEDPHWTGAIK